MVLSGVVRVALHDEIYFGDLHELLQLVLLDNLKQLVQGCQVVSCDNHLGIEVALH